MNTQPILAFDCATFGGSVALMHDGRTRDCRLGTTQQAAQLLPAMNALLHEAGLSYGDIACMVSTLGPGSFTGVRIGLAALHGLVLVQQTPIKMLTTLEAMAWAVAKRADAPAAFFIALRAGKGELYSQRYTLKAHIPTADGPIALVPEQHTAWNAPCYGNQVAPNDAHFMDGPDAATMCAIAHDLPITPLAQALPVYVRAPDAVIGAPHAWLASH